MCIRDSLFIASLSWDQAQGASQAWVVFRRNLYHELRRKPESTCPNEPMSLSTHFRTTRSCSRRCRQLPPPLSASRSWRTLASATSPVATRRLPTPTPRPETVSYTHLRAHET